MDLVVLEVDGPRGGRDVEQSARVAALYEFRTDGPAQFTLAPAHCVVLERDLGSRALSLLAAAEGYVLTVSEKGEYRARVTLRAPVAVRDGRSLLSLPLPPALRSRATLRVPEPDLDVSCEAAVFLETKTTKERTEAEAVFGIGGQPSLAWKPRVRRTTLEQPVFYCTVNSLATLQPGVADVVNAVSCQIAQGEIRGLKMKIPAGMNVTAVQCAGLATWNFDPASRRLDVMLEQGVSGEFNLMVGAQVSCEGLPYTIAAGVPVVEGASRQRGALAFAAADTVQVRVDATTALNPMNIEDFAAAALPGAAQRAKAAAAVRRAFRYDQPAQVAATVSAERVLPEIRVTETGSISISDERTVLGTKLELAVAKAGIFSVELALPDGFDVESLTGADVSHWDELRQEGRGVVVHFARQVNDATTMDLVVARTEKGIEPLLQLPRVGVKDARKHGGRLVVAGERGVRMMVQDSSGVDAKKATEVGIRQAGVLVFEILRPNWSVALKTEVLAPVVKPEVLQVVDLTEGMLLCRAYVRYAIENAGVKSFRFQAPAPGVSLSVSGAQVARVQEVDAAKGLWQVDLHAKQENRCALTLNYQIPYDRSLQRVAIAPLRTLDTDPVRGYLVVSCGGRVQIEPEADINGLKVEDARNVPAVFGAGDLSAAVRCYRIVQPDWALPLSVVRHESAQVLPASVTRVRMTSVLSADGRMLTRAVLQLDIGSLRLLKLDLPHREDMLWTALVNGREATVSRDGAAYCVPLEKPAGGQDATVDLVYSGSASRGGFGRRQTYEAPRLAGLPLRDIEWTLYAVPGVRYYDFGGTMEHRDDEAEVVRLFGSEQYWTYNIDRRKATIEKAREVLNAGNLYLNAGKSAEAMKAFQDAVDNSRAQADLNEDARVQLRNLQKQNVKVGLFQRRAAMRSARNIMDEDQAQEQQAAQVPAQGPVTPQVAQTVDRILSEKDKTALETVADRMIDQQAAAAGVVRTINVTVPENGRMLRFYRAVLISPTESLSVSFKSSAAWSGAWRAALPVAGIFMVLWAAMGLRRQRT
jgi:hypothetical protein